MSSLLETYIKELEEVDTVKEFEELIIELKDRMQKENVGIEIIQNVRAKAKYFETSFPMCPLKKI